MKFLATNTGHKAASIDGMAPGISAPFKGQINEEIELTLPVQGLYGA